MQFTIPAMSCASCVRSITLAIHAVDPGAEVAADLTTRRIEVATQTARDRLATMLADIGYTPAMTGDSA